MTIEQMKGIAISTHTLTWSVTSPAVVALIKIMISTHTLTWSVTMIRLAKQSL